MTSYTLSIIAGIVNSSGYPTPGPAISSKLNKLNIYGNAIDSNGNIYDKL